MRPTLAKGSRFKVLWLLSLLAASCLLVLLFAFPKGTVVATHSPDDFNRAGGSLTADWTNIHDGGLSISAKAVTGRGGLAGDIWTAQKFTSDQYSQIEVTSKQLTGNQWIGAAVRTQQDGEDAYVGLYYWNDGNPELMLAKRIRGSWTQLGDDYSTGPLTAGTQLKVMAVGSTILLLENGVLRVSAADSSLSGGAPGIMIDGTGTIDDWSGGPASSTIGLMVQYTRTDAEGVKWYQVVSSDNGPGPQALRVLAPTHPARGMSHNFLYVLPVQPMLGDAFNDGLETLRRLDAQDRYNLTIIEPTFGFDPWYADNPKNANIKYETFITQEVVPWVEKNFATTGHEENWLIGFSKSGLGAQDLLLKHPDIFALAASWDFPADMSSYDESGADPANCYGTNANFQDNYRLTTSFINAHKEPFMTKDRIWIGGSTEFPTDMSDYAKLLTKEGVAYSREAPQRMAHSWNSGWIPVALAALWRDSIAYAR